MLRGYDGFEGFDIRFWFLHTGQCSLSVYFFVQHITQIPPGVIGIMRPMFRVRRVRPTNHLRAVCRINIEPISSVLPAVIKSYDPSAEKPNPYVTPIKDTFAAFAPIRSFSLSPIITVF